jgi:ribosomal protein L13E
LAFQTAGILKQEALGVGIAVDYRRRNKVSSAPLQVAEQSPTKAGWCDNFEY